MSYQSWNQPKKTEIQMEDQWFYPWILSWAHTPSVSFCTNYPNKCFSTKNRSANPHWPAALPTLPAATLVLVTLKPPAMKETRSRRTPESVVKPFFLIYYVSGNMLEKLAFINSLNSVRKNLLASFVGFFNQQENKLKADGQAWPCGRCHTGPGFGFMICCWC